MQIMKEEDKMEIQMKQTEDKYRKRMEEQFKIKEQLLDKLKAEEQKV